MTPVFCEIRIVRLALLIKILLKVSDLYIYIYIHILYIYYIHFLSFADCLPDTPANSSRPLADGQVRIPPSLVRGCYRSVSSKGACTCCERWVMFGAPEDKWV